MMSVREVLELGVYGKVPVDTLTEVYLDTEDGETLTMYQAKSSGSLGTWVYDGATCLAKYLESLILRIQDGRTADRTPLKSKRVIELGAGTGIVGLLAAHYGAEVYVTDFEALVPLLQYNVDRNKSKIQGSIIAKALKWGDSCQEFMPPPDYLILANCIYYVSSFEPLLETMLELCGKNTQILACYEIRTAEIGNVIDSWHKSIEKYFSVSYLPDDELCTKYRQHFIKLCKISKV